MSAWTDWFSPIQTAINTVEADWQALFKGGQPTETALMKLGADVNAGVLVAEKQILVGLQALAIAVNAFIPKVQAGLAEAQVLAVAYPAALPWIAGIEGSLAGLQLLNSALIANNTTPTTIPDGLAALINAGEAIYAFEKNLLTVAKK